MPVGAFRNSSPQESAYSQSQISAWLRRIGLPEQYGQYIDSPSTFPKSAESLATLFRCQITTFPYENLSVHYSATHLVTIKPDALFNKMMGPPANGRGGYCMELSIFFHHMLRGLGFHVYMTGVRNRTRSDGVPNGEYQGWTHINNIIHLPDGSKFSADVAFGGDGPTSPLPMNEEGHIHQNLGSQQVRLIHDMMPKQQLREPRVWIYQYRNGADKEWNSFYSFAEIEFFAEDFEVQNWWASAHTLHRWTVLVVRFLREGDSIKFLPTESTLHMQGVGIVGKVMLVNNMIKVNMGGKTLIVQTLATEAERVQALNEYFGIQLTEEECNCIQGWDMALVLPI